MKNTDMIITKVRKAILSGKFAADMSLLYAQICNDFENGKIEKKDEKDCIKFLESLGKINNDDEIERQAERRAERQAENSICGFEIY